LIHPAYNNNNNIYLFQWWKSWIFSIITPVFRVWCFREHSKMLIWCLRNISFIKHVLLSMLKMVVLLNIFASY